MNCVFQCISVQKLIIIIYDYGSNVLCTVVQDQLDAKVYNISYFKVIYVTEIPGWLTP